MSRRFSFVLATSLVLVVAAPPAAVLARQPAVQSDLPAMRKVPGRDVIIRAGDTPVRTTDRMLQSQASALSDTPTADIQVTYSGFSAQARAAFEAAVGVWERTIVSSQPIHVSASWEPMDTGILGGAGPEYVYYMDGAYYPSALREAICSCEVEYGYEMGASFNSAFSSWYLGTDGNVPSNKWDLYSVVLHEIGHGLGFIDSFGVSGSIGYWGLWDGYEYVPLIYDTFVISSATGGNLLINDSVYPNDSSALKTQLADGSVYFAGQNAAAANGGRARLFAPNPFQPGSSIAHVDESTYPLSTGNSLMTPYLDPGEAERGIGPVATAMLQDMGWDVASSEVNPVGPPNDGFGTATQIRSFPFEDPLVDNASGTMELGEPQPTCNDLDASVWYKLQPTKNYSVKFEAIANSDIDLVMAVYEGSALGALTQRACADSGYAGEGESKTLAVASGHTYYVQLGGYAPIDTFGWFTFRATKAIASPANDNFAQARTATLGTTYSAATGGATLQAGEPNAPCVSAIGKTVWYRYTPARTRTVVANTVGSNFDTVIAVYAGSDLAKLTPVACNDDRPIDDRSKVKFTVYSGTTYYFQVGGYNGAGGALKFALKAP